MAQFAKNSTNYTGARSKTFSSRENTENKYKKRKKKGNETNAWDKRKNQNDSWGNSSVEQRRETRTLWDNMKHEFPACDTAFAAPNAWEQKQRTVEKPNVWVQRQMKFQENKALEPQNEDEEEKMIRLALELSKRETDAGDRRRRLEEEYLLQEQMLRNNPDEFKEFLSDVPLDENLQEKFPVDESNAQSQEWDDGKYAMALKSNATKKVTSSSSHKTCGWNDNNDNGKQKQPSPNYKPIDNWEGYTSKTQTAKNTGWGNEGHQTQKNKSSRKMNDNWGDCDDSNQSSTNYDADDGWGDNNSKVQSAKSTGWDDEGCKTQKNKSSHKINDSDKYDNWGDCDDVKQSSTNYDAEGIWGDYEEPQTQKNEIVSQVSKSNSSDNWGDIGSSEAYDRKSNSKEQKTTSSLLKPLELNTEDQKENNLKPGEDKTSQSANESKSKNTIRSVRKVVDMFGGWGSSSSVDNTSRKVAPSIVDNSAKNNGMSLSKTQYNRLKYESNEVEKLTSSVQEIHLDAKKENISTSKEQLNANNGNKKLPGKVKNGSISPIKVPELDTEFQTSSSETFNAELSQNQNSVINEAVSFEKNQSEYDVLCTKSEINSVSPLLTTVSMNDSVLTPGATTSVSQTHTLNIETDTVSNTTVSKMSQLGALNFDESYNESNINAVMPNALPNTTFSSSNENNQANTFSINDVPKQVPTFQSNECITPHYKTTTIQPNEYINLGNEVPSSQSNDFINPPKQSSPFPSNENISSSNQIPTLQNNNFINAPKQTSPFQSPVSDMNAKTSNMASSMPYPTFPAPESTNLFPPTNQLGSEFMNPNLMGGITPLMFQYMQMMSNPFLAAQLQACQMYYTAMGMPIGPMLFPQVPMMPGLTNPTIVNPVNSPFPNNPNDPNLQSNAFRQPVINAPLNPSNATQNTHHQYNPASPVNTNSVHPDIPLKLDDETESLLRSFLSPKEEPCNDNEIFIKPPVVPTISEPKPAGNLNSSRESMTCDYQSDVDKSFSTSSSEHAASSNTFQTTEKPSECIGWGDVDSDISSKSNQNAWDDDIDGWGSGNSTTKAIGNPSQYNSTKSTNRQPSRQPKVRHYKR